MRNKYSSTLQELDAIQYASYNGAVNIDEINGQAGFIFPIGTVQYPVNNMGDALLIASLRGFDTFKINDHLDIDSGASYNISQKIFKGRHMNMDSVSIGASAIADKCLFKDIELDGTLDGETVLDNCSIGNLTYVDGTIKICFFEK